MSFFDNHPVILPWPEVLRRSGLKFTYKPREVWWKFWIEQLKLKSGEKVLEVGCGRGIFLNRLSGEYGIKAWGIDIAREAIFEAQKESVYKHEFVAGDAAKLPFPDSKFDVIVTFDALEHIRKQNEAISEMARVLKKGGRILIYTINSRQKFTWDWFLSLLGKDVYKNIDHDPKLFLDPKRLENKLKESGVKVENIAYFNAFFSLIADEAIMVFLSFWQKFFGWKKTGKSGKIILKLLTFFSVIATPILRVLDLPWTIFGQSNGILVVGVKR